MKVFNQEELEMIQCIRDINNDQTLDEFECLAVYEEIVENY